MCSAYRHVSKLKGIVFSSKELFVFSLPIVFGQVGQMLIGAGDTLVAARYSTETVAAVGLAGGIMSPLFVAGLGFMSGAAPILATKRGEGEKDIGKYLFSIIVYSVAVAVVVQLLLFAMFPLIPYLGMDEQLVPLVKEYTVLFSFSFLGAYLFQGLKEFLQSFEDVVVPNVLSIVAVFINIALNLVLVFGVEPVPEFGIKGLAFASILVRVFLAISVLIYAKKYFTSFSIQKKFLLEVLKLSTPIAFTIGVEVAAFSVSTIIVGNFGMIQTAAHNVVLTLASITFMVPLAISSALSVKVGYAYGEKNIDRVKQFIASGLFLSLTFMGMTGALFFFFPAFWIELFTQDTQVVTIGITLLYLVAMFQLVDGTQITLTGILRGLGETKSVFVLILVAYWVAGIPFGSYLAFYHRLGAQGVWIGLTIGLFLIGSGLIVLLKKKMAAIV